MSLRARTRTCPRTLSAVAAGALTLVALSCGGSDDGPAARPDPGELAIKFRNEIGMTPAQADCTAGVLVDSELSDDILADVYDTNLDASNPDIFAGTDLSDENREAIGDMAEDLGACVGVAPQTTLPPGESAPEPPDADATAEAPDPSADVTETSADG